MNGSNDFEKIVLDLDKFNNLKEKHDYETLFRTESQWGDTFLLR